MLNYKLKTVKGKTHFDVLFKNAFKFYEKDAAIFVCFKEQPKSEDLTELSETIEIQYAVTARKRNVRKAVMRNRIKRLLRESLRQTFDDYSSNNKITKLSEFVIVWNSAPARPGMIKLSDVLPVARKLIDRAESYKKKQDNH